jgi:hypothetical protein
MELTIGVIRGAGNAALLAIPGEEARSNAGGDALGRSRSRPRDGLGE